MSLKKLFSSPFQFSRLPLIRYEFVGMDKAMHGADKDEQELKRQERQLEKKWFSFMDR